MKNREEECKFQNFQVLRLTYVDRDLWDPLTHLIQDQYQGSGVVPLVDHHDVGLI